MSIDETRTTTGTRQVPRPRQPEQVETTIEPTPAETAAAPATVARFPWPEPWGSARGARPRTEFWDHETASWRSRGPVVPPQDD
jgi:hypothetical protein